MKKQLWFWLNLVRSSYYPSFFKFCPQKYTKMWPIVVMFSPSVISHYLTQFIDIYGLIPWICRLLPASGESFMSIAPLEMYMLGKMMTHTYTHISVSTISCPRTLWHVEGQHSVYLSNHLYWCHSAFFFFLFQLYMKCLSCPLHSKMWS